MTAADIREAMQAEALRLGSKSALAEAIGTTRSHLSDMMRGRRSPAECVVRYFGLKTVKVYVEDPYAHRRAACR